MSDSSVSGACLCEAVRFKIDLPTLFCGHCHCSMCRRNHGAGYVTWFGVTRAQLEVQDEEGLASRYASSEHGSRTFCSRCGSSLFFESTTRPEHVDIPLANVDGRIDRPPQFHVHFDERVDWMSITDDLPRLGGSSGMEPLEAADAVASEPAAE